MRFAALAAPAVAALVCASPAAAAPVTPYPVPYHLFVEDGRDDPAGSAAGSNDFSCRPTAAHPEPVVLVHGLAASRLNNWTTVSPLLANEGHCVFALTYGAVSVGGLGSDEQPMNTVGGLARMEDSAQELSAFVDRVRAETGADAVNIVTASEGSVVAGHYVKFLGGADRVRALVSLGPAWNGTLTSFQGDAKRRLAELGAGEDLANVYPVCKACPQLATGSDFLVRLRAGGVYAPNVQYTNIMTRYDQVILPFTNGYEAGPNATNIVVQDGCEQDFADHIGLAADPRATGYVLGALDPAHPRPVPCEAVLPLVG
ncbi:esterase/lipase family protein [Rhodococcus tukisamuensis]|uniref:Triacylglycerol lipase n=1 Tax=Rhodococcus tukisamuensis TaxID=168276 RepID=A0A1G6NAV7_9NOCA|nr:alpha/beta fold hydrolase [Rhodococcus tukisamuensis]SDC64537.1 triacylglycerol lipase [Rhodococcus tukisamuensis]